MALTREERNARKAARNHAKLMAMTPEEHTEYNTRMLARRRMNELLPLYVEFGFVAAELRGDEYIPPEVEPVEPPISIRHIIIVMLDGVSEAKSTLLKPAVLAVTD